MNSKDMINKAKEQAKIIFTPRLLKKLCALTVIGACLAGGGAWYHHQQKEIRHAQILSARAAMTEAQAQKLGINLLSENSIRTLTADAIGQKETDITYRVISLEDERDNYKKAKYQKNNINWETTVSLEFQPVYKVYCLANQVKYKLVIDAVTGEILKSHVG